MCPNNVKLSAFESAIVEGQFDRILTSQIASPATTSTAYHNCGRKWKSKSYPSIIGNNPKKLLRHSIIAICPDFFATDIQYWWEKNSSRRQSYKQNLVFKKSL
jgi:hypothetical protein